VIANSLTIWIEKWDNAIVTLKHILGFIPIEVGNEKRKKVCYIKSCLALRADRAFANITKYFVSGIISRNPTFFFSFHCFVDCNEFADMICVPRVRLQMHLMLSRIKKGIWSVL